MNKKLVIRILEDIAVYMEIKGENAFKVSAYRKAAQTLAADDRSMEAIGDVSQLKGIGKGTAAVINDIIENGQSSLLETLKAEMPEGLLALLQLPGLGGKKIARLYQELGIASIEALQTACQQQQIRTLSGFGAKTEDKLLEVIGSFGSQPERLPLAFLLQAARQIEAQLDYMEEISRYSRAGSFRRVSETSKDLDYVIATDDPDSVADQLAHLEDIDQVENAGKTKVTIAFALEYVVSVDFRLVDSRAFATTLHHFTGSMAHNVQMRQLAKARGEKISEYGVEQSDGSVLTFATEAAFFQHFDLPYILPELRDGQRTLTAYQGQDMLVREADIKADLHMHTTWSDGGFSIEDMAEAARAKGYEHMAITDHSKSLVVAKGLNEERWRHQHEAIQALNEKYDDFTLLSGIEMDILADASLDFSDDVLKDMDIVIASIHSAFSQSEEKIMERLKAALYNPHVDVIAHPTGRIIGRRDGYAVDVEALIHMAAETGTALELNANPNRLDLSPDGLRKAADQQVPLLINTDAHTLDMLQDMTFGVSTAQKAWLSADNVVNTWSLARLREFLQRND